MTSRSGRFSRSRNCWSHTGDLGYLDEDGYLFSVGDLDPAALVAHCRERLAPFQVPRYVRFIDALPRTQTERVEKYKLRADGVTPDTGDAAAPRTLGSGS